MSVSGIKCACNVKQECENLSKKHLYRYITFKLSDDQTQIVVDKPGEACKTFEDLKNDLPKDDCRYALFDLTFETQEHQKREKVIFISFVPDDLPVKKKNLKMLYSTGRKAIVDAVGSSSLGHVFQFSDFAELDLDEIIDVMRKKTK